MIRKSVFPFLLLFVTVFAWFNSASLDRQSGKDFQNFLPAEKDSALATPLFSARRVPVFLQAPIADKELKTELEKIDAQLPGLAGVNVLEDGRVIYERLSNEPVVPASTQKLLTAIALLDIFGPDHKFTTRVLSKTQPVNGLIEGDLWLIGGGDPLLMTAKYAERYKDPFPYTNIKDLVMLVVSDLSLIHI